MPQSLFRHITNDDRHIFCANIRTLCVHVRLYKTWNPQQISRSGGSGNESTSGVEMIRLIRFHCGCDVACELLSLQLLLRLQLSAYYKWHRYRRHWYIWQHALPRQLFQLYFHWVSHANMHIPPLSAVFWDVRRSLFITILCQYCMFVALVKYYDIS